MKRRLILIAMLSIGVATSSYNTERDNLDISENITDGSLTSICDSADSLVLKLEGIKNLIDEKHK